MSLAPLLFVASLSGPISPTQVETNQGEPTPPEEPEKTKDDGRVLLDRLVATVNDDVVTLSELRTSARPYLSQNPGPDQRIKLYTDVREELINERLMDQQIGEADITVSDGEVEAAIADILRRQSITREQLMEAVTVRGVSFETYKNDVKDQLTRLKLIDLKVRSRVVITEEDLKAEFESQTRDEVAKSRVEISHILLRFEEDATPQDKQKILERARDLQARVTKSPDSFSLVARETSQGPTASRGGSLGELAEEELLPELAIAVKPMEIGQISDPIVTPSGIHIVKLEGRRKELKENFEAAKGRLRLQLQQQRVDDQMKVWIAELRKDAALRVFDLKPEDFE